MVVPLCIEDGLMSAIGFGIFVLFLIVIGVVAIYANWIRSPDVRETRSPYDGNTW